ncbi:MAG: hypothetical protein OXC83_01185 [Chloroflexi bacterium]|nr:hypothetical protein [Chloroflexota bacterium]
MNFESLTPENLEIVKSIMLGSNEIPLPSGDVLVLANREPRWVRIGYDDYLRASFLHRCLGGGVEHPEIRMELETQQRLRGWDRLEFARDASMGFDLGNFITGFKDTGKIGSIYRVAEGRWIFAKARVNRSTCGISGFGYRDLVKNSYGLYARPSIRECPHATIKGATDFCPMSLQDEIDVTSPNWLAPITNAEIETGRIQCRKNTPDEMRDVGRYYPIDADGNRMCPEN